ncbi:hypothetical protein IOC57_22705 [Bacillus sp. SD075]|uniref:hypothetical protein n=1 Tax=Bacillus sp. SD075 TaxID=2781732 RepID=UPI000DE6648D|nr:hypothetical protein [Bacillus sp. SD075]MBO1000540.1 hypothetical protein [Bacillus sp. SD075]SSS88238.1 Uncharacterised protein [Acinetobacter baumannii]
MPQTTMTFDRIETEFLKERLEKLIQSAYEKGVEDGMKSFSYPPVLRNSHLAEILQIAPPTVIKVTSNPSFPRLQNIKGRYPRDLVFEWIETNSTYLKGVV